MRFIVDFIGLRSLKPIAVLCISTLVTPGKNNDPERHGRTNQAEDR